MDPNGSIRFLQVPSGFSKFSQNFWPLLDWKIFSHVAILNGSKRILIHRNVFSFYELFLFDKKKTYRRRVSSSRKKGFFYSIKWIQKASFQQSRWRDEVVSSFGDSYRIAINSWMGQLRPKKANREFSGIVITLRKKGFLDPLWTFVSKTSAMQWVKSIKAKRTLLAIVT